MEGAGQTLELAYVGLGRLLIGLELAHAGGGGREPEFFDHANVTVFHVGLSAERGSIAAGDDALGAGVGLVAAEQEARRGADFCGAPREASAGLGLVQVRVGPEVGAAVVGRAREQALHGQATVALVAILGEDAEAEVAGTGGVGLFGQLAAQTGDANELMVFVIDGEKRVSGHVVFVAAVGLAVQLGGLVDQRIFELSEVCSIEERDRPEEAIFIGGIVAGALEFAKPTFDGFVAAVLGGEMDEINCLHTVLLS